MTTPTTMISVGKGDRVVVRHIDTGETREGRCTRVANRHIEVAVSSSDPSQLYEIIFPNDSVTSVAGFWTLIARLGDS